VNDQNARQKETRKVTTIPHYTHLIRRAVQKLLERADALDNVAGRKRRSRRREEAAWRILNQEAEQLAADMRAFGRELRLEHDEMTAK
jgi:hypothetical protein